MKQADALMLRAVQKNAWMEGKAADALAGKVYDDDLALQLARSSLRYAQIGNRAADELLSGQARLYRDNALEEWLLLGSIHAGTLFDTSVSHIAERAIQESSRGMARMCRALHAYENAGAFATEIARELIDLEENHIERLKKYL